MASPSTLKNLKETLKAKYGTLVDNTYLTELINDNVNNEANATDENLFDTLIQSYLADKSNQTIDNFLFQDISKLKKELPSTVPNIANAITTVGAVVSDAMN